MKDQIIKMIKRLFNDTSQPVEDTKEQLIEIREIVSELIETLE